jgi:O-antigen/teichoic acid export membrane protein
MLGLTDSLILQALIQFGMNEKERPKVNLLTAIWYIIILMGFSFLVFLFRVPFSEIFNQSKLIMVATYLPVLTLFSIPRNFMIKIFYRDYLLKNIFIVDLIYFASMTALTFYYLYVQTELSFVNMITILLCGNLMSSVTALIMGYKQLQFGFPGQFNTKRLFNYGFPLTSLGFLHSLPKYIDIYIIQLFFSTTTVGIYSLAKNIYRVFDEILNALYGLMFPISVKYIEKSQIDDLRSVYTKATSFTLITFLVMILVLEAGFAEYFINNFFPDKYVNSLGYFRLLIFGSIALPFVLLTAVIVAEGRPQKIIWIYLLSSTVSISGYFLIGLTGLESLVPFGLILYNFVLGFLSFMYVKRKYGFPVKLAFRSIIDSVNFAKDWINNKRL